MPTPRSFDTTALEALLRHHEQVVTIATLRAFGVPAPTISRWLRPGGRWRRLLPGVVLAATGRATTRQRLLGAKAYGGPDAVITGEHALAVHGALRPGTTPQGPVRLLVPNGQRCQSAGFVVVERTRRVPSRTVRQGLVLTGVARACVDQASVPDADPDGVRELFSAAVHARRTTLAALDEEVHVGRRPRSHVAKAVLAEIAAGVRSAAEGRSREILLRSGLPRPVWGNELLTASGEFLLQPDAYWPAFGVALEIDSMLWHSTPEQLRRTQARQRLYAAHGVVLITIAPADVDADPAGFVRLVERTLAAANPGPATLSLQLRPAA